APSALAFQPALGEGQVARRAIVFELDAHYPVADLAAAVPGTVLGNEDGVAVFRGEQGVRVKAHAQRRDVGPELYRRALKFRARALAAECGIGYVARVTVRIAEMQTRTRRVIQLVVRDIVTHQVASVIGEPQLLGLRMPVETD